MRRGLIEQAARLLKQLLGTKGRQHTKPGRRAESKPQPSADQPSKRQPSPAAKPIDSGLVIEYTPTIDGDPDPGEVVWTWVAYEEDPSQGKDRPVLVIGHSGGSLVAVPLTSKKHDNEEQVAVGTGSWDSQGRPSYAKVERLVRVDAAAVRREGAILPRDRFDAVVAAVKRLR